MVHEEAASEADFEEETEVVVALAEEVEEVAEDLELASEAASAVVHLVAETMAHLAVEVTISIKRL